MKSRTALLMSLLMLCSLLNISCNSEYSSNSAYQSLSMTDKVKMQQYVIQGKELYQIHCQSCHQEDGSGLGKLIPPITRSKFILNQKAAISCIIRKGLKGKWEVDGIEYDGIMPPNRQLTNLEIAEIITFIGNQWENQIGLIISTDVEQAIMKCK